MRLAVVTALVTCAPIAIRRRSPLLALAISSRRDPRPLPAQLAAGIAADSPRCSSRTRSARGARCGRRSSGSASCDDDRRARHRGRARARHASACSASSPSSRRRGRSVSRCATAARRPSATRRQADERARGRAPDRGPRAWRRSGCGSRRSCTTSSPTRCRSSPSRRASARTSSTNGRSRPAPCSRRSRRRRAARSPRCAGCSACSATATASAATRRRPGLADLPRLVDDVRAAGVPATLHVEGDGALHVAAGVELSAYRVVQEALTNVIKHAGTTDACRRDRPPPAGIAGGRGRRRRPRARGDGGRRDPAADGVRPRAGRDARAGRGVGRRAVGRAGSGRRVPGRRRCCRTVTRDDDHDTDPGRGRRRPGARPQRLHDAALRRARHRGRRRGRQRRRGRRARRQRATRT